MTSWNDIKEKLLGKQRNVAILAPSSISTDYPTFLTKGKWVSVVGKVGIIADMSSDGIAEVHYVNGAGVTIVISYVPVAQIQVARLTEIPEARRPSAERGAVLGYI